MRLAPILATLLTCAVAHAEGPATLAEWSKRSEVHAKVVAVLEDVQRLAAGDRKTLQEAEPGLVARLHALGAEGVGPMRDMVLRFDAEALLHPRLFLARVLATSPAEGARAAIHEVLRTTSAPAVAVVIARSVPATPASTTVLVDAFDVAQFSATRCALLRELCTREGFERRAFLAKVLTTETDPALLAEAVTSAATSGETGTLEAMRALYARVPDTPLRQRLLVVYAQLGGADALAFVDEVSKDAELAVRASAVLAIGRVGGERALAILDRIAREDPAPEVRLRAERMAKSLRDRAAPR